MRQRSTRMPAFNSSRTTIGGTRARPSTSRASSRNIAMSSTSARTMGRIPASASRRSKSTRMSLSRLGNSSGWLRRSSGNRNAGASACGRPTRLTGCRSSRWLCSTVPASRRTALLVSTTSTACASSCASSSRKVPERTTTEMSARAIKGRRNSIWKLRESVVSAPTFRTGRFIAGWLRKVLSNSSPAWNMVSA